MGTIKCDITVSPAIAGWVLEVAEINNLPAHVATNPRGYTVLLENTSSRTHYTVFVKLTPPHSLASASMVIEASGQPDSHNPIPAIKNAGDGTLDLIHKHNSLGLNFTQNTPVPFV